jgi:hypothetical protein
LTKTIGAVFKAGPKTSKLKFKDAKNAPLSVVKFCNVIKVGLFSNFKSFMIFDLCLEILERKARSKLEEFLLLSSPD